MLLNTGRGCPKFHSTRHICGRTDIWGARNVCSDLPPLFSLAYFLFSSRGEVACSHQNESCIESWTGETCLTGKQNLQFIWENIHLHHILKLLLPALTAQQKTSYWVSVSSSSILTFSYLHQGTDDTTSDVWDIWLIRDVGLSWPHHSPVSALCRNMNQWAKYW